MHNTVKAHAAVLTANVIFAANYTVVKLVTPSVIKPFGLNLLRVLVSTALFWILYLLKPSQPGVSKRHLPRLALCAATGVVINQILFIKGLAVTTSIHASLLSLGTPIFITLIAAWILKERFTVYKLAGLILAVAGGTLLVLAKEVQGPGTDILFGDTLILINAVSYAFYLVLVRPLMEAYSPIHVLRWVFTLGTILIIPFGSTQFVEVEWAHLPGHQWLSLGFIAVGATFLAYLFNVYSIKTIGSSATGTYIYTQPVFAAVLACIVFDENINLVKIFSGLLIFTGVFLVNVSSVSDKPGGINDGTLKGRQSI